MDIFFLSLKTSTNHILHNLVLYLINTYIYIMNKFYIYHIGGGEGLSWLVWRFPQGTRNSASQRMGRSSEFQRPDEVDVLQLKQLIIRPEKITYWHHLSLPLTHLSLLFTSFYSSPSTHFPMHASRSNVDRYNIARISSLLLAVFG